MQRYVNYSMICVYTNQNDDVHLNIVSLIRVYLNQDSFIVRQGGGRAMNDERIEDIMSTVFWERTGKQTNAEDLEYFRLQKAYEQRFGEQLVFSVVGHEERSYGWADPTSTRTQKTPKFNTGSREHDGTKID